MVETKFQVGDLVRWREDSDDGPFGGELVFGVVRSIIPGFETRYSVTWMEEKAFNYVEWESDLEIVVAGQ